MDAIPVGANRIAALMYHRIGEPANEADRRYCVRPREFKRQMRELEGAGYTCVSIDAFFRWLDGAERLPEASFVLTFDDGFKGIRDYAVPVLAELGWPCAVFLVSALIGGTDDWNGAQSSAPLLDRNDIMELAEHGVRFESHTRRHRHLPSLGDEELAEELVQSKSDLESLLDRPVQYLAYPFGESDDRVVAAARNAGYTGAFCAEPGFNRQSVDRYRVRRLDVFGTDSPAQLLRKLSLGSNDGSMGAAARYFGRSIARRVWG